ncbi:site-specific integrase [Ruegeria arenilitoris]|uniref:site-specific integrase n=1 Tax=Ruegeria arenilitoris TaxID=1173585 RepID=UPI00147F6B67|nr:site-specific integrase [Ruegeria arenilitoris]
MASISKYKDRNGPKWKVFYEHTDRTGKRVRRSRTFRDHKTALAFKAEVETQTHQGVRTGRSTLAAYLNNWVANKVAMGEIRHNTLDGYRAKLDSAKRAIGHIELAKLVPDDVEFWLRGLLSGKFSATGRELSPTTVRQCRTIMVSALGDAVRKRLLPYNVAEASSMPRAPRKGKKPSWTVEQAGQFLSEMDKTPYGHFFRFIGLSGCRRSEAGGLLIPAIRFPARQVVIETSLMRVSRGGRSDYVLSEPKSDASHRTLPLSAPLEAVLWAQLARVAEFRLAAGNAWVDTGGVFVEPTGEFYRLDTLSAIAWRTRNKLGLPEASAIHGLRHAFGKAVNATGTDPKTLQQLMGHSRFQTTYDLYVDTDDAQHIDAMDKLGSLLGGNGVK